MTGESNTPPVQDYPMRWRHELRGGYGYVAVVPCRVLQQGEKRVKIAALKADGTEVERWVAYESLRAPRPDFDPRIDYPERYQEEPI